MGIHIIVDGYNLIRQSPQLRAAEAEAIESGREALLELLWRYKKVKGHQITVVFDAWGSPEAKRQRQIIRGIRVIYSRAGERADEVIKEMAKRERERAVVVTSDREIRQYAERFGAASISSPEFEARLEMAIYFDLKGLEEEDEGLSHPPRGKKLPKKQRRQQARLRKL
ncbi:NYN domain-containing protein [Thermosulfuriphilus sp.]